MVEIALSIKIHHNIILINNNILGFKTPTVVFDIVKSVLIIREIMY